MNKLNIYLILNLFVINAFTADIPLTSIPVATPTNGDKVLGVQISSGASKLFPYDSYISSNSGAGLNIIGLGYTNVTTNIIHLEGFPTNSFNGNYYFAGITNLTFPNVNPASSVITPYWTNTDLFHIILFCTNANELYFNSFLAGNWAGIFSYGPDFTTGGNGIILNHTWDDITNQWQYLNVSTNLFFARSWFGTILPGIDIRGSIYGNLFFATNLNGLTIIPKTISTNQLDTNAELAYRNPLYGETVSPTLTNTIPHRDWAFRSRPTPGIWYNEFGDLQAPDPNNVNGANVTNIINSLVNLGFVSAISNAGVRLMFQFDAYWQGTNDTSGVLQPNYTKFPGGISNIVKFANSKGIDVALYVVLDSSGCDGSNYITSRYVYTNVATWYKWGIIAVKVDDCFGSLGDPGGIDFRKNVNLFSDSSVRVASQGQYSGRNPIWFDYSIQNNLIPAYLPMESVSWEDGADSAGLLDTITSVQHRLNIVLANYWTTGPGHTQKPASASFATYGLQQTNHWMVAAFAPNHLEFWGYPWTASQISHYTNLTLLNINQDPYVRPLLSATTSSSVQACYRWLGPTIGNTNAILLINSSGSSQTPTFNLTDLKCDTNTLYDVFDVWTQSKLSTIANTFSPGTLPDGTVKGYIFKKLINDSQGFISNTNSTAPANTTTIRAWMNVTNDSGKVGKIPVYY